MDHKEITCSAPACRESAPYKVAAPWTGGRFTELKTYGFACPHHIGAIFRDAEERRAAVKPASDEAVGAIAIYRCEPGKPGWELQRREELEEHNRSWGAGLEGV
jgi:hypothetical protein